MDGQIVIWIVVGIILFVVIVTALMIIGLINKLRRMNVKCDEAESGIDVALTKRFDLLTKAIETVKGYAKHESETLKGVIAMRAPAAGSSMKDKAEFANTLTTATKELNLVVEGYPELKADKSFLMLQHNIADVEEHLQAARRVYNSNVSILNQTLIVFPNSLFAGMSGVSKREFFEAEEAKREDVKVSF